MKVRVTSWSRCPPARSSSGARLAIGAVSPPPPAASSARSGHRRGETLNGTAGDDDDLRLRRRRHDQGQRGNDEIYGGGGRRLDHRRRRRRHHRRRNRGRHCEGRRRRRHAARAARVRTHLTGGANGDSMAGGFGDDTLDAVDGTAATTTANGGPGDDDVCTVDVGDTITGVRGRNAAARRAPGIARGRALGGPPATAPVRVRARVVASMRPETPKMRVSSDSSGGCAMSATELDLPLLPSAEQIRRREFATIRRGYDPEQVRDYLGQVAAQVETLERQLREARLEAESAHAPDGDPRARGRARRSRGGSLRGARRTARRTDPGGRRTGRVDPERGAGGGGPADEPRRARRPTGSAPTPSPARRRPANRATRSSRGPGWRRSACCRRCRRGVSIWSTSCSRCSRGCWGGAGAGDRAGGRSGPGDRLRAAIPAVAHAAQESGVVDPNYEDLWVSSETAAR